MNSEKKNEKTCFECLHYPVCQIFNNVKNSVAQVMDTGEGYSEWFGRLFQTVAERCAFFTPASIMKDAADKKEAENLLLAAVKFLGIEVHHNKTDAEIMDIVKMFFQTSSERRSTRQPPTVQVSPAGPAGPVANIAQVPAVAKDLPGYPGCVQNLPDNIPTL